MSGPFSELERLATANQRKNQNLRITSHVHPITSMKRWVMEKWSGVFVLSTSARKPNKQPLRAACDQVGRFKEVSRCVPHCSTEGSRHGNVSVPSEVVQHCEALSPVALSPCDSDNEPAQTRCLQAAHEWSTGRLSMFNVNTRRVTKKHLPTVNHDCARRLLKPCATNSNRSIHVFLSQRRLLHQSHDQHSAWDRMQSFHSCPSF